MGIRKNELPGRKLSDLIISLSAPQKIVQSFTFVHCEQTPNVALYVTSGLILVGKQKITIRSGEFGRLFYFDEFVDRRVCHQALVALAGVEVSIIDRQVALQIMSFNCISP